MNRIKIFFFIICISFQMGQSSFLLSQQKVSNLNNLLIKKVEDTLVDNQWIVGGGISVNLSQASFTNWISGGVNTVSINGLLSLFANYKFGKNLWYNLLDLGYGVLQQGNEGFNLIKTDDKIDLFSKYGRELRKKVFLTSILNFKTQFANGYNVTDNQSIKTSTFFAPAYLQLAGGIDYQANDNVSLFVSPVAGKFTFVLNQALANEGAFGVKSAVYDTSGRIIKSGSKTRSELGFYLRLMYSRDDFKVKFFENIGIKTKLELFSNYLYKPQNMDISWEVLIRLKINKYLSTTLSTHLIYDDDVNIPVDVNNDGLADKFGPRIQFKQIFAFGLIYNFIVDKKIINKLKIWEK